MGKGKQVSFTKYWNKHYGTDIQDNSKPKNVARYVFNYQQAFIDRMDEHIKSLQKKIALLTICGFPDHPALNNGMKCKCQGCLNKAALKRY